MELRDRIRKASRWVRALAARSKKSFVSLQYGGSSYRKSKAMSLSAVYGCVTAVSRAVAQLPLNLYRMDRYGYKTAETLHPAAYLLGKKPNARMTRYTFMELVVQNMLLRGAFYAYILRDKDDKIKQLIYLPWEFVTVETGKYLDQPPRYKVTGIDGLVDAKDMFVVLNQTSDGITGISTISYAAETLGLAYDSEKHARNFFAGGCGVGGILKSPTRILEDSAQRIKARWNESVASSGSNGVVVLDQDLDFRPVQINPTDAQLLETRKFNVEEICRFFGINPVMIGDNSKSSYNTAEAMMLAFLTQTLAPLLEKIELEIETKLFSPEEHIDASFDVSRLLRADKQSAANYFRTLFSIGAIAPNEIRREIDLPRIDGGDSTFVQVNLQTLESANKAAEQEGSDLSTTQIPLKDE